MSDVDIGTVITGIEAVVLLTTLIFMYYQYRKTMSVMSAQLSEIRKEIRITTHEDIYEKLLGPVFTRAQYPFSDDS